MGTAAAAAMAAAAPTAEARAAAAPTSEASPSRSARYYLEKKRHPIATKSKRNPGKPGQMFTHWYPTATMPRTLVRVLVANLQTECHKNVTKTKRNPSELEKSSVDCHPQ